MAKFSLARVPYYIAVTAFTGFSGLVAFWNNATAVGVESDIYLAAMVLSVILALNSIFYIFTAKSGADDEVGVEVAGMPIGKKYYYFAVLGVAVWRGIVGYQTNHSTTGIESIYGVIWLLASIGIALFTYANYKSFVAKQTPNTIPASGQV